MEAIKTKAYGATNSIFNGLAPMEIERHAPQADEVHIDILYCGVCHSDLHQAKNDWGNTIYPCVPGHEVVGRVTDVGSAVTKFKAGDIVGVGCMIDSCGQCQPCQHGEENYCQGPVSWTATYNGPMKPDGSGTNTFGGYSTNMTVKESFVLRIPDGLDINAVAPILCAGITTYSPLKHWKVKAGDQVGVVGLGGLGHMAVKLAKALGANVTAITTSKDKQADAEAMGADKVLFSTDADAMKQHEASFSFILNTIPDKYDINDYVNLLNLDGAVVAVGLLGEYKKPLNNMDVAKFRRTVAGSIIGGIAETQEVLDFCAQHNILPDVEMIRMQDINKAFDKMMDKEVRYRYVIDMQSLKDAE
ncbi:NADP-dependent alcohol dehydrogenase [Hymenobacter qilianensis]|uniref:NADP-dependent alcohol dehydrogenase n=2 Tax=Hymenobacter qilianensis TaxID=1385715 RepID=A0ACB5PS09_9BACT|nr:NAD(P)-dependent alcohol dehydrogenase [Hymenobacter qilianensis]QNP52331.1 NAD(P)-dependent alcohol dehydrogenase [Hymenobacter qilianensis]GGF66649.1 NADP-dependent alcohol dehydrogenase [Hymenobacter qilianensis]